MKHASAAGLRGSSTAPLRKQKLLVLVLCWWSICHLKNMFWRVLPWLENATHTKILRTTGAMRKLNFVHVSSDS